MTFLIKNNNNNKKLLLLLLGYLVKFLDLLPGGRQPSPAGPQAGIKIFPGLSLVLASIFDTTYKAWGSLEECVLRLSCLLHKGTLRSPDPKSLVQVMSKSVMVCSQLKNDHLFLTSQHVVLVSGAVIGVLE